MKVRTTTRHLFDWTRSRPWPVRLASMALSCVAYTLLGFVFLVAVVPHVSNFEIRRVISGSMEPNIALNDLAITRGVNPRQLHEGDVILFAAPSHLGTPVAPDQAPVVLHRITKVVSDEGGPGFETKGDNNEQGDAWVVPAGNVRGQLVLHVPYAGYIFVFLASRLGYLLGVLLPGFVLMVPELLFILRWVRYGEAAVARPLPEPAA